MTEDRIVCITECKWSSETARWSDTAMIGHHLDCLSSFRWIYSMYRVCMRYNRYKKVHSFTVNNYKNKELSSKDTNIAENRVYQPFHPNRSL